MTLKSASYVISIFGFLIGIFWLTLFSQIGIMSLINTMAAFFGPIFGVMIVDYYFIKEKKISNQDIYSVELSSIYYYSNGWHIKGIYALFLGFIFSISTIWNPNLISLQPYGWIIGAIVSAFIYYLLAKR